MKQGKIQRIAILGLLTALLLVFGLTPLGTVSIGPVNITLMGFPVIIGTLLLGWKDGLILGFLFGLVNFLKTFFAPSALTAPLLLQSRHWYGPVLYIIMMFAPRMLVPLAAWALSRIKLPKAVRYGIASVGGSLTNTVGFLGLMFLFFAGDVAANYGITRSGVAAMLGGIAASNGVIEAIFCALCSPIACAVEAALKKQ